MPPQNQQAIEQEREHRYNQIILPRDELSMNLGGGLPKNSLMLASGPDGAGKSIFAQRLCYGFLRNKTSVTYISSELDTIAFVEPIYLIMIYCSYQCFLLWERLNFHQNLWTGCLLQGKYLRMKL
jgi:archaellum biogenesis ATPase FlaH